MMFIFYGILLFINFILFLLVLIIDFDEIDNRFVPNLYTYISIPIIIYSIIYFIYIFTTNDKIYDSLFIIIMMSLLLCVVILSNIVKLLSIYSFGILDEMVFEDNISLSIMIIVIYILIIIITAVSPYKISDKSVIVEKCYFEHIDFNNVDIANNINEAIIIDENNEKQKIDLNQYNFVKDEETENRKYISKELTKIKKENIFGKIIEEEEYEYYIYTTDIEEKLALLLIME